MPDWFWGYFVSYEGLVDIFLDAGGILNPTAKILKSHARIQARRCIFKYLMPGRIQILLTYLDGVCGLTFVVGPDDVELKDLDQSLLRRCWDMFLGNPGRFIYTDDPDVYTREINGVVHRLDYLEDVECDETADWYHLELYYDRLREKATKSKGDVKTAEAGTTIS